MQKHISLQGKQVPGVSLCYGTGQPLKCYQFVCFSDSLDDACRPVQWQALLVT